MLPLALQSTAFTLASPSPFNSRLPPLLLVLLLACQLPSTSHLCGISGTMAATMEGKAPYSKLFAGDVSLSVVDKPLPLYVRALPFPTQPKHLPLWILQLSFFSNSFRFSPFFLCLLLPRLLSQKLAELIHEISRFISPGLAFFPPVFPLPAFSRPWRFQFSAAQFATHSSQLIRKLFLVLTFELCSPTRKVGVESDLIRIFPSRVMNVVRKQQAFPMSFRIGFTNNRLFEKSKQQ